MKENSFKKVLFLFLVFGIFLLVGCDTEPIEDQGKSKTDIQTNAKNRVNEQPKEEQKGKNDKIKDISSIIEFVNKTDTNKMTNQLGEKLIVLKDYETHYFDFTGEGLDDVAIVTWADDNSYNPVIFVTTDILENEYSLINSDFRATKGSEFFSQDGFIIKNDKKHKSYDIAYNIGDEFIQMATRYVSYGDETQIIQPEINLKYIVKNTLEKLDGFNKFNVNRVFTYLDEKGNTHKYEDTTLSYTFNEKTHEFDMKETQRMERISIEELIKENFIVGKDDSLKAFETVYNEGNLESAINYYYENRQKFSKETRINYLENYSDLVEGILDIPGHSNIYATEEVKEDNVISSVTVNIDPIPEKMSSVFSIVKEFFVEDGASFPEDTISNGRYTITCINSDMTEKMNLMSFDQEVLVNGEQYNANAANDFVNVEFKNQQQMLEVIKDITYPTVLINNLQQLDEFKHKNIWKTNIVIVPGKIVYKS